MNVVCIQCWAIDNCIIVWKQFQIDLNSPKPIYDSVYAIESLIKLLIVWSLKQWVHLVLYLKFICYFLSGGVEENVWFMRDSTHKMTEIFVI